MPSTPQVVPTIQVFDYELTPDALVLNNAQIEIWLSFDLAAAITPLVNLESKRLRLTTDPNGYWQVNLVPNANISPANTVYNIRTPYRTYQIIVPSAGGPYQSSSLATTAPPAQLPAGPFTQGSVLFAGASGAATQDNPNFFWDATNHRLGIDKTNPAQALDVTGQGVFSGALAAASAALTGALTAASATLTGALNAASAALTGALSAASAAITGALTAGSVKGTALLFSMTGPLAGAATLTPDATVASVWQQNVNQNLTINAPTNPSTGQLLIITLIHDGTANTYALAWNAVFKPTVPGTFNVANSRFSFPYHYDGAAWQSLAGFAST
jgi:hypothetical protein